ncbi:dicarboxylate/amino acid:cation symporter [Humibacter sp. RRB41]|uniref:dicarboxylate/amino acid:cation symporter n=1 Tax=Humibacter sp. RRB41 TaxID=2919946 RepID=UPI001FAAF0B0|nr:dicarboxylate/amino acid:cation symporter [Humibacter sp. RRB41]
MRWLTSFGVQIIAGLVAGVIVGLIARSLGGTALEPNWLTTTVTTIGNSYVSLLTAAVVPLVFTAVVSSIANLRRVSNAARLAVQTLIWFAVTAFVAVLIGIALGLIVQPGVHTGVSKAAEATPSHVGSWWAFLTGLIPSNIFGLGAQSQAIGTGASTAITTTVSFNVLQVLVISAAIGIAALLVGKKAEPFLNLTSSVLAIIQKVLWWIIRLAPLGTLALIAKAVATYGWDALGSLGVFVIAIYIGLVIILFVVYPIIVRTNGLSIKQYYSGAWPAIQLGFVSRSSMGTMPLTERVTERNLGVPREYAAFAVPLGATTKMDGCAALYPALASIFVAQFYGIHLTLGQYLLIIVVAVIGSAATAGTTGATVMLTLTLSTLGLPLAGVGLLLAIDPIIDMGRTAINVAGQALVPTIVAKRNGILDLGLYNAARGRDPFNDDDVDDREAADSDAAGGRLEPASA